MMSKRFGGLWGRLAALPIAAACALAVVSAHSAPASSFLAESMQEEELDQVIFRDGRIVKGILDEETDETVSIFVVVGTIRSAVPTVFQKSEILSVIRGSGESIEADEPEVAPQSEQPDESAAADRKLVYHIKLDGWFGRDFNVTPLSQAVDAAKPLGVDYLLIEIDNRWRFNEEQGRFDELMIAKNLEPILRQNLQVHWDHPPEVIMWVKNAMGGAAFIPFFSPNIYFASDGRMGGIGDLGDMFEGVGDEVVRDKQKSLRLAWAKSIAIPNGYDERLIEAMTWRSYVLYYTMEGGRPVYHTEPVPGAELLTDDGEGENADTDVQLVRGEGNDVLTLRAELAQKLGVSKGTADSIEDIMFYLGILDNYELIDDKPERILSRWSDTIDRLEREIPKMFREFNEIQVQGDYNERKRARGAQINILKKIIALTERYEESLQWSRIGVPPVDQLRVMIESIRLQQIADRP